MQKFLVECFWVGEGKRAGIGSEREAEQQWRAGLQGPDPG